MPVKFWIFCRTSSGSASWEALPVEDGSATVCVHFFLGICVCEPPHGSKAAHGSFPRGSAPMVGVRGPRLAFGAVLPVSPVFASTSVPSSRFGTANGLVHPLKPPWPQTAGGGIDTGVGIEAACAARRSCALSALLELSSLPDDINQIALAENSVTPGEVVQTVGNPGSSGALWVYSSGTVRAVYHGEYRTTGGYRIDARVVETQIPTNSGDSGGPVVNSLGQLVAINQSHTTDARLINHCIDVTEIKDFVGKFVSP